MKIFISHHRTDVKVVRQLKQEFGNFGISPKTVNLHRALNNDVLDKLDEVVPNIDYVIVILSKAYVGDKWFDKELAAFCWKERELKNKIILPVIVESCDIPPILGSDRKLFDLKKITKIKLSNLTQFVLSKRQVFVVMKLGDEALNSMYEGVIKPVMEEHKYSVIRIDAVEDSGRISEQILHQISRSEIIVADLTGERPNCYYEAGYAHALGKEIIFTVKDGEKVHFDLAGNRFILWKTEGQLRSALIKRLEAIQKKGLLK